MNYLLNLSCTYYLASFIFAVYFIKYVEPDYYDELGRPAIFQISISVLINFIGSALTRRHKTLTGVLSKIVLDNLAISFVIFFVSIFYFLVSG